MESHNESELLKKHKGLVKFHARRYLAAGAPLNLLEDLEQAGFIGLLDAIRSFDPQKGSLSNHASPRIKTGMRRLIGVRSGKLMLGQESSLQDDHLASEDASPEDRYADAEQRAIVRAAIRKLSDREKALLMMRFEEGVTVREAARRISISSDWADEILRSSKKKLAKTLRRAA